ncbi:MAG: sulfatase-like hydrolase/transferase, partial [Clostridia bacterium]|nr:sulfatase-like hydrolase/transferase [Clostridia bacterium]
MRKEKAEKRGLFSFFLFRKTPDKKPVLFWIWNFLCITAASVATGVVSLMLAYGNYPSDIFRGYFKVPLIAVLNILPVLVLTYLLYFITGRSWIAHLVVSGIVVAASVGDYYKLRFRDDPFIAADIPAITTGLKVSGNYEITVGVRVIAAFAFVLLSTLFLAFFVRGLIRFRFRTIGIVAALLAAWPVTVWCLDKGTFDSLENFDYPGASPWSDTQKQITRGFVYPFIHSVPDAIPQRPAGYSDARAAEILSPYESEDIPDDKKVNIIGIQLEAFSDFERFGVEGIDEKVYDKWRELEKESLTGTLVTNIFAGGTIDTERCFLTGLSSLDNFRAPVGSYVRYFSSQGYFTEGAHASYDWFYNRKNINSYIGFDEYWFSENRYREMTGKDIGLDDVMIPDILELYRSRDKSVPYFNFSVTYQGHGPYADDNLFAWGDGFWEGEGYTKSTYNILNNYFGSIADTSERISWFIDELRSDPDPVVV